MRAIIHQVAVLLLNFLLLRQSTLKLFVNAFSGKEQGQSVSFMSKDKSVKIRPFDLSRDMNNLKSICENVYGGTDYLVSVAPSLAENTKTCSFLVLQDEDDAVKNDIDYVAVANYKRTGPSSAWLECVRTSEKYNGKGYATMIVQHMVQLAKLEKRSLSSCTISSNTAMQSVFRKCGFQSSGSLHVTSFGALLKLKGWSSSNHHHPSEQNDSNSHHPPQNLIDALGLQHLIGIEAKELVEHNNWYQVHDVAEATHLIKQVGELGGCGNAPSIYNILSEEDLEEAVRHHRIYALNHAEHPPALLVFHRDDRIKSLRSPWVCSVTATTATALESALWLAITSKEILAQLDGHTSFFLAFDSAIPIDDEESLPANLPLAKDTCMLYTVA